MLPSNDRGRPVTIRTPSKMSLTDSNFNSTQIDGQIRCTRCGAILSADESIRRELGPVCRRQVTDLGAVA